MTKPFTIEKEEDWFKETYTYFLEGEGDHGYAVILIKSRDYNQKGAPFRPWRVKQADTLYPNDEPMTLQTQLNQAKALVDASEKAIKWNAEL